MNDESHHELHFAGMANSPSFVRQPEGDGCD
jgi:hypothetical protein